MRPWRECSSPRVHEQARQHHRAGHRDDDADDRALQIRPAQERPRPEPRPTEQDAERAAQQRHPLDANRSRRENSMPIENIRRTTPISANSSKV